MVRSVTRTSILIVCRTFSDHLFSLFLCLNFSTLFTILFPFGSYDTHGSPPCRRDLNLLYFLNGPVSQRSPFRNSSISSILSLLLIRNVSVLNVSVPPTLCSVIVISHLHPRTTLYSVPLSLSGLVLS